MRIGVDLDDTICRTTEIVHDRVEQYANVMHLNSLDIMNDEILREAFYNIYLEDIYYNAEIKRDVCNVLKRLRSKGNEIYVITARKDEYLDVTKDWLRRNEIEVDGVVTSAYGDLKARACKKYGIDLLIEDNPYNYKIVTSQGINCILFDDREKYDLRKDYITSWREIEKYIERNR